MPMSAAVENPPVHQESPHVHLHHDRDLIHDLSRRLDALGRYDQYIANAPDRPDLQAFWVEVRTHEAQNIQRLNELIRCEIQLDCILNATVLYHFFRAREN